jgi:hypothetical protein
MGVPPRLSGRQELTNERNWPFQNCTCVRSRRAFFRRGYAGTAKSCVAEQSSAPAIRRRHQQTFSRGQEASLAWHAELSALHQRGREQRLIGKSFRRKVFDGKTFTDLGFLPREPFPDKSAIPWSHARAPRISNMPQS